MIETLRRNSLRRRTAAVPMPRDRADGRRRRAAAAVLTGLSLLTVGRTARLAHAAPPESGLPPQLDELVDEAQGLGSWDREAQVIGRATDNVFEQQGWTSEPDRFARRVLRDVERIPWWRPQEREQAFMRHVEARLSLSEDQVALLRREMNNEALHVAVKYFKDTAPIAMEIIRTRARQEPFTAEQVQRWSKVMEPMMEDARRAFERVSSKLEATMTPEQREIFRRDVRAVMKRHNDFAKMVGRWKEGKWDPTDWGLQDDAVHAATMRKVEAEKDAAAMQADLARARGSLEGAAKPTDESSWDRYVRLFCLKHQCNDRQKGQALTILRDSKQQAVNYRTSRQKRITELERLVATTADPEKRAYYEKDLAEQQAPVGELFEQMCRRLETDVLTTEQRKAAETARRDGP